ncbi:MAG: pre-rRNA-processing protein pno1 [Cirrosporium novae-zelandiae]|nr:MAG: pre-rRNA-processing protein pno1 [Cirrosporium novae-zelandiae]
MPAPTALQRQPEELSSEIQSTPHFRSTGAEEDIRIESTPQLITADRSSTQMEEDTEMAIDSEGRPRFPKAKTDSDFYKVEHRTVRIPPNRLSGLKAYWPQIYPPLVEHLKLQTRVNIKNRCVELRTSKHTADGGSSLQKGEDFVKAFCLGFDIADAVALLRLDDLYIETFEIKDVKRLEGEHLSRAIGRIAGKDGKMKFSIENASRTRIVLANSTVHILGGFSNIHIAREAICCMAFLATIINAVGGKPAWKSVRQPEDSSE